MKAVLSPCLFFPNANTEAEKMTHSQHLFKILDFIYQFLDLELDRYSGSPYDRRKWYKPNFEYENLIANLLSAKVFPLLLKMLNTKRNLAYGESGLIIDNDKTFIQNKDFILPQNENSFLSYLKYLSDNKLSGICFIGLINQSIVGSKIIIENNCFFDVVKNPWIEKSDNFNSYIKESSRVDSPIFVNKELCVELENLMRDEEKNILGNLRGSHYKEYARIIAYRNNFEDFQITNPYEPQTDYYKRRDGKYIISVDLIHGRFEVFHGSNELWFAEYSFSGEELYAPTNDKELNKMRQNHRLRRRSH